MRQLHREVGGKRDRGRRRLVSETAEISQITWAKVAVSAVKNTPQLRKMPCSFVFFPLLEQESCIIKRGKWARLRSFDDPRPSAKDFLTSRTSSVGSTSNWFKIDSTQTVAYHTHVYPKYLHH